MNVVEPEAAPHQRGDRERERRRRRGRPASSRTTAGRSAGSIGFGTDVARAAQVLAARRRRTPGRCAMPTAATAKPAWYPPHARASADEERRGERADVDAHVEDREARVAPRVVAVVQLADHARHVRLEQAGAERDQARCRGTRTPRRGHREEHVPGGDDDAAVQDRAPRADHAVREPAAEHGQQVDRRRRRSATSASPDVSLDPETAVGDACRSGRTAGWRASRSS